MKKIMLCNAKKVQKSSWNELYSSSFTKQSCSKMGTRGRPSGRFPIPNLSHTHTPFNSTFSGTTRVSRYQKGKTNLDFTGATDNEWQWHQLGHMQDCTSLQTDKHASTPPLSFFTGRMPFLPPNQQRQSTEFISINYINKWSYGPSCPVDFPLNIFFHSFTIIISVKWS